MLKRTFLSTLLILSGCSSFLTSDQAIEPNTKKSELFSQLVAEGQDTFVVSSLVKDLDYTTCEHFVENDNKVLSIYDACINPLSLKKDNGKIGVLKSNLNTKSVRLSIDDNVLDFNVHEIVLEDGTEFESINIKENLPFQKSTMIKLDYNYIDTLNYMTKNDIIDKYWMDAAGIHYTLNERNKAFKKGFNIQKDNLNDLTFDQDDLLRFNFLSYFFPRDNIKPALNYLNSITTTYTLPTESGLIFSTTKTSSNNFIDIQGANTTFSGDSGTTRAFMAFAHEGFQDIKESPVGVVFDSGYYFEIDKIEHSFGNNMLFAIIPEGSEEFFIEEINNSNKYTFIFEKQNPVELSFDISKKDKETLANVLSLINLMR